MTVTTTSRRRDEATTSVRRRFKRALMALVVVVGVAVQVLWLIALTVPIGRALRALGRKLGAG